LGQSYVEGDVGVAGLAAGVVQQHDGIGSYALRLINLKLMGPADAFPRLQGHADAGASSYH
jgi:hypothetical protein